MTYIFGDIHGGYRALVQLLSRIPLKKGDKLIFLGDYVDGWSESAEVIDLLLKLSEEYECIFLRGNHDEWCNEWMKTGVTPHIWLNQGGRATFDSYYKKYEGNIPSSHQMFFYKLLDYYIDEDNNGFVHGGFHSRKGLGHEHYHSDYYWDRDLWNLCMMSHGRVHLDDGIPQGMRMYKHKEIFIGHTSTLYWKNKPHYPEWDGKDEPITVPMNRCNVWNLDTGGGFNGKITAICLETKEYYQSDFVKDLYPEERGRN